MNTTPRFSRTALSLAVSATLVLGPCPDAHAATLQWTGQGISVFWAEALNWFANRVPTDGEDLVFGSAALRTRSRVDLTRSFSSLTYTADAPLFVTDVLGDGAQLTFTGAGIVSLTAVGSVSGRQAFFADAGSTGGTILFTNSSGINLGSPPFARAVDITAQGGATVGAGGGHVVFQDKSTTGGSTFDVLRAAGASVAAASGGEIVFRDTALVARLTSVVVGGGAAPGAPGGRATWQGQAQNAGGMSVQAGQSGSGGLGGRVEFSGNTAALGTASIYAEGGTSALAGSEAVVAFRGDAQLLGSAYLGAGRVAGANGGRIDFFDHASHDTTSFDPSSGSLGIYNVGAVEIGAGGGALVFHDDSAIRGSHLFIANQTAEFVAPSAFAGSTSFLDRSRAGQVAIENAGSGGVGAVGGASFFRNQASAENATIVSLGGFANGGAGGSTLFSDSASADSASLRNVGGSAAGALGGTADFKNTSRAGTATIVNAPGQVVGATGGVTTFAGNAGAGRAFISNDTSFSVAGGGAGRSYFRDSSSAQQARIDNQGGLAFPASLTAFYDNATAGNAGITNFGGKAAGVYGGFTQFFDRSSAGNASIVTAGGGVDRSLGGVVQFFGDSTAGSATIDLRSATVAGAGGAVAFFSERSNAGNAGFIVQGSQVNNVRGPEAAGVTFDGVASASSATFAVGGNVVIGGATGAVDFRDTSTAANASFSLLAGLDRGGALTFKGTDALHLASAGNASIANRGSATGRVGFDLGGNTTFQANATAASARITNESGVAFGFTSFFATSSAGNATIVNAGGRAGEVGGGTQFNNDATADRAIIDNFAGARRASGFDAAGRTDFNTHASAGNARITAGGASTATDIGGLITFGDTATAARATLIAEGGSGAGSGGRIRFAGAAIGDSARVMLNAGAGAASGGELDISAVSAGGIGIGSLEGGGLVRLGARSLTVGSNNASTTFSGVISDGGAVPGSGGSLTMIGAGRLTLSGANLYTGDTHIGDGISAGSGKLVAANTSGSATGSGTVFVERGGTLGGAGSIDGPTVLRAGGIVAPGDPVTLTLRDSLTWDGGGLIRLVLGADNAGSDHLVVGSLARGATGPYVFDLIDTGIVAGTSYDLLHFDRLVGFVASDFTFAGAGALGRFSISDGSIDFTAAAVPEPGSAALLALGLLWIYVARKGRTTDTSRQRSLVATQGRSS